MRRWLTVLTVAALAVALVALPGAAKEKPLPDKVVFAEGEFRLGAVEARTGDHAGYLGPKAAIGGVAGWTNFMDPNYNYCKVTKATLTWTGKNTAELETYEDCSPRGKLGSPYPPPQTGHVKIVHITKGGALKMAPGPGQETWKKVPFLTGCSINGTFPIYHGHFDGERLYAATHYNSICDGGFAWSNFGIGAEDGPIHVTYEFDLRVSD